MFRAASCADIRTNAAIALSNKRSKVCNLCVWKYILCSTLSFIWWNFIRKVWYYSFLKEANTNLETVKKELICRNEYMQSSLLNQYRKGSEKNNFFLRRYICVTYFSPGQQRFFCLRQNAQAFPASPVSIFLCFLFIFL